MSAGGEMSGLLVALHSRHGSSQQVIRIRASAVTLLNDWVEPFASLGAVNVIERVFKFVLGSHGDAAGSSVVDGLLTAGPTGCFVVEHGEIKP
jgi:hypothetical protein